MLTLCGAPGAGKTRLALALADAVTDAFAGGVFAVDLSAVTDAEVVATAIAQQIGLRETGPIHPATLLRDFLADRETLLFLDNFEQVVQAAPLLTGLLASCPRTKLLVTSRIPLNVTVEQVFEVLPLGLPDLALTQSPQSLRESPAVALFLQRAESVREGRTLSDEEVVAAAEVSVRLDGLPLALELAAARCRLLSPRTLLERLERRLELLTGGPRDVPERHQTLRGAIGWSYSILSPEEQAVFRRLAVFSAGCELGAAESVCANAGHAQISVLDAVHNLVASNLLQAVSGPGGTTRLRFLETIREYAQECLASSPGQIRSPANMPFTTSTS